MNTKLRHRFAVILATVAVISGSFLTAAPAQATAYGSTGWFSCSTNGAEVSIPWTGNGTLSLERSGSGTVASTSGWHPWMLRGYTSGYAGAATYRGYVAADNIQKSWTSGCIR